MPRTVSRACTSLALEDPGFGAMKEIVQKVMDKILESDSFAVDYPASGIVVGDDKKPIYNFFQYRASVGQGIQKFDAEVEDFTEYCPDTPLPSMYQPA